jgi:hypothetical protein
MGFEAKKTEHSGPKRGNGAYWGYKWEAKKESNRIRRENAKREIRPPESTLPLRIQPVLLSEPKTAAKENGRYFQSRHVPRLEEAHAGGLGRF